LIGVTAAFGLALAMQIDPSDDHLAQAAESLERARPTAVNLGWAIRRAGAHLRGCARSERPAAAFALADVMAREDVECNESLGEHGLALIRAAAERGDGRVSILTHCNAGWLATVDWGTATAPIYKAMQEGIEIEVFVDETRPRNQGASLTAWELSQQGVSHHLIVDNAGGHLMRQGKVDMVIVGADRIAANGDVCNKIGTYLKALAAFDNKVPFHVAAPSSSIDFSLSEGVSIAIEERDPHEVTHISGLDEEGVWRTISVAPAGARALNPGFDVTPARLVSSLITERGVCAASASGLAALYPDHLTIG